MTLLTRKSLAKQKPKKDRDTLQKCLLAIVAFLLVVYLGLSFLAPVLMKAGCTKQAGYIYKAYRLACHQLAYRSFFLYGEQAVYPRELAGIKNLQSYEEMTGFMADDLERAKSFVGNEQMGYKVVLCQRDTAIYASILVFILLYTFLGKKIKLLPWWLWVLLAVLPIGVDGFWQVFSQLDWSFLDWLPARESTPFLRVLTGALFGFFSAWFIIPSFRGDEASALRSPEKISNNSQIAEEAE